MHMHAYPCTSLHMLARPVHVCACSHPLHISYTYHVPASREVGQDTTLPDMIHSHGHPDPLRLREGLGEMKDFHFVMIFREDPLDQEMATHSSNLAWRIPWTAEPGRLQSMGILQARILEWVAMPSSRGSSQPRDQTQVSSIAGGFFTT